MEGDDLLRGKRGKDTIYGGTGSDRLIGGRHSDALWGGAGIDVFRGRRGRSNTCDVEAGEENYKQCVIMKESQYPVVVAAGDLSCNPFSSGTTIKDFFNNGYSFGTTCRQGYVSAIALSMNPTAFLGVGDYQYGKNVYEEENWATAYTPSWGRLYDITFPTRGNHDNGSSLFATYFSDRMNDIFTRTDINVGSGPAAIYSFDIGNWHIVALNRTPTDWLEADLASTTASCILAYQHLPISSSGPNNNNDIYVTEAVSDIWDILDRYNVSLVVSGDDHHYERFQPQGVLEDPDETKDREPWKTEVRPDGVVQFVVGTGGANTYLPTSEHPHTALDSDGNRVVATNVGFLKLTLKEESVDYQYVIHTHNPTANTTMMPLEGFFDDYDPNDGLDSKKHVPTGVEIWDEGTVSCRR